MYQQQASEGDGVSGLRPELAPCECSLECRGGLTAVVANQEACASAGVECAVETDAKRKKTPNVNSPFTDADL